MTQITLELQNEGELVRLLELLRQFDVRIVQKSPRRRKLHPAVDFYLNLSQFKFNCDEAKER